VLAHDYQEARFADSKSPTTRYPAHVDDFASAAATTTTTTGTNNNNSNNNNRLNSHISSPDTKTLATGSSMINTIATPFAIIAIYL